VNINGVEGIKTGNVFHVKLPYTTDISNLKPEFTGNCSSIYPKGVTKSRGYSESVDFSNPVTYVAVGPDGKTEEYTVVITFSDLPTIYITTSAPIVSKDEWVKNNTIRIFNAGENNGDYSASLKGRGNSTWVFPKKPYAIKLDSKEEVLGMPKHKRWCLLANWMDRTNIRNEVAFEVGRRLSGLEWTPRGKFVDLIFNGTPVGNYYLCEQIKIDKNRINTAELEITEILEPNITGGYLLEFDSYFDETYKFRSSLELPINLKSPDENVPDEQSNYIKNYINTIEDKLIAHADFNEIDNLIDINSYVDWWILNEIVLNGEPNYPKSSYMYKKRDGKLFAGPAWDYDWGTFVEGSGWWIKDAIWYKYLFSYPEFISIIKERWNLHKNNLSTIGDYIDKIYYQINESSLYDCTIWPINPTILGGNYVNGDELLSFSDSVKKLKQMYLKRFQWLDKNINSLEPNEITIKN
ncbi:MAG: CotH kinase family protein, partial [Muribaculaceae bacterium]|nr:CotH kinase family protein [Muribaculaceae bacterium]